MSSRHHLWVAVTGTLIAGPLSATEVAVCTERGRAVLELAEAQAPLHVANFLRYVESGHYSGTVFHRAVRGFVTQGGGVDRRLKTRATLPPVVNESRNGLRNQRGSVAAARLQSPDSASAQFFVNLADNTDLDAGREPGFTVFGHVKEGIEVFDEIARLPTAKAGPFRADVPTPLVAIKSVARYDAAELAALPTDGREAWLKERIAAADAANDSAEAMRLIGQYRAVCGGDDAEITLTEARLALAADNRRRAVFVLDDWLATTPASAPSYAAATELYRAALKVVPECEPAVPPPLPDGALATREEMVTSQQHARTFVTIGDAYLACLAKFIDDESRSAADRNVGVTEHNRMVGVMEETAAAFNEQLRVFKARK